MDSVGSALMMHRTATILPSIEPDYETSWIFEESSDLFRGILENFIIKIDKAAPQSLMMFFWGTTPFTHSLIPTHFQILCLKN